MTAGPDMTYPREKDSDARSRSSPGVCAGLVTAMRHVDRDDGSGVLLLTERRNPASPLADLFAAIDTTHFHPHPMTLEEAERIVAYEGRDVYLWNEHAYGMLRGWDEGYAVPSLGVAVRRDSYGRGHGRAMMLALHAAARERGAQRIRLRVHPANGRARSLYESLGYVDAGEERRERVMVLELA